MLFYQTELWMNQLVLNVLPRAKTLKKRLYSLLIRVRDRRSEKQGKFM